MSREGEVSPAMCGERTGSCFLGKVCGNDNETPKAEAVPAADSWCGSQERTRPEVEPLELWS